MPGLISGCLHPDHARIIHPCWFIIDLHVCFVITQKANLILFKGCLLTERRVAYEMIRDRSLRDEFDCSPMLLSIMFTYKLNAHAYM